MRRQPSAYASNTSASSRGYSEPFLARCLAVQSNSPPIVQPCGSVLIGWPTKASFYSMSKFLNGSFLMLSQALLLVEILERLNQLFHLSGNNGIQLVQVQVDAMVGDAVLRKIIRADALTAIAGTDQRAALLGAFLMQLLLL